MGPDQPADDTQEGGREVPLTELMRQFPREQRWEQETHFADDGSCIGHRMWPVGRYMHEAADRIERLTAANEKLTAERDEARTAGNEYIRRTDPMLACHPEDFTCGTCRACYMQRAESAEARLAAVEKALGELVRLKDLRDAGRANEFGWIQQNRAWEAARALSDQAAASTSSVDTQNAVQEGKPQQGKEGG